MKNLQFFSKQGFNKYLANTSWLLGENIVRMAANFVVGIYLARYLGPDNFGLLNYVSSFVALFLFFATLGLDSIVIRELVKHPEKKNYLMGTCFALKSGGTILMWLLLMLVVTNLNNAPATNYMIAIIAAAVFFQSANVVSFYFQSVVQAKYLSIALFIQLLFSCAIKVYLIINQAPLVSFAWVYFIEALVLAIVLLLMYQFKGQQLRLWRVDFSMAGQLLRDSWVLVFSGVLVAIYMKIDLVMIKHLSGNTEAGLYAASTKLSEAWYFIPIAICGSLFPAIIGASSGPESKYNEKLLRLFTLLVWIAVAIAIPISLFSDPLIALTFGSDYQASSSILKIHIWSGIFVFLGVASSKWLVVHNYTSKIFYRSALGAVVNVVLNLYLIPIYGGQGAAIATLISYIVFAYLYDLFDRDLRPIFYLKSKALFYPL